MKFLSTIWNMIGTRPLKNAIHNIEYVREMEVICFVTLVVFYIVTHKVQLGQCPPLAKTSVHNCCSVKVEPSFYNNFPRPNFLFLTPEVTLYKFILTLPYLSQILDMQRFETIIQLWRPCYNCHFVSFS